MSRSERPIGIGSPRASLEANFALQRLVGRDRFFAGVAGSEWARIRKIVKIFQTGPARSPSLHEIECSDAVLILGEDVTNSAPGWRSVCASPSVNSPLKSRGNRALLVDGRRSARNGTGPKGPILHCSAWRDAVG